MPTAWIEAQLPEGAQLVERALSRPEAHDVFLLEPRPEAVRACQQHVTVVQRDSAADAHIRQRAVAAEAALNEIAHRVAFDLAFVNEALAQQNLDVTVVARAPHDVAVANLVDA